MRLTKQTNYAVRMLMYAAANKDHLSRIPEIAGTYFYGDYFSGQIWGATESGGVWSTSQLFDTAFNISTFGED